MTSTEFRRRTRLPQRPVGRTAGFMLNGVEVSSNDIRIKNFLIALRPKKPRKPKKKSKKRLLAEEEAVAKEIERMKNEFDDLEDFQLMTEDAPRDFYTIKRKRKHSHKHRHKRPTSSHENQLLQQPVFSSSFLKDDLTQKSSVIQKSLNETKKIHHQKDVSEDISVHTAASIDQKRKSSLYETQLLQRPGFSSSLFKDDLTQKSPVIQKSSNTSKVLQQKDVSQLLDKDVSIHTAASVHQERKNSSLYASQPIFDSSISILNDDSIRRQSSVIKNISERNEVARKEVSIHTATAMQIESPLRVSSFNNQQIFTTPSKSISIVEESPPLLQHQSQPKEIEESQKENIQNIEDEAILISDESLQNILEENIETEVSSDSQSITAEIDEQMEDYVDQSKSQKLPKEHGFVSSILNDDSTQQSSAIHSIIDLTQSSSNASQQIFNQKEVSVHTATSIDQKRKSLYESQQRPGFSSSLFKDDITHRSSVIQNSSNTSKILQQKDVSQLLDKDVSIHTEASVHQKRKNSSLYESQFLHRPGFFSSLFKDDLTQHSSVIQKSSNTSKILKQKDVSQLIEKDMSIHTVASTQQNRKSSLYESQLLQQPVSSSSILKDNLTQQLSIIQKSLNVTKQIHHQKDVTVNTAASTQQNRKSSLYASQPIFDSSSISILKNDSIRRQSSVIQNVTSSNVSKQQKEFSERNEVVEEVSIHTATAMQIESPLRTSIINPSLSLHQIQNDKLAEESHKENIHNIEDDASSEEEEEDQDEDYQAEDFKAEKDYEKDHEEEEGINKYPELENVLENCDCKCVIYWEQFFAFGNFICKNKINEGSYGEVFLVNFKGKDLALKVIPIDGDNTPDNIFVELYCARKLTTLQENEEDSSTKFYTPCYIKLEYAYVVKGKYHDMLLNAFDQFKLNDKIKEAQNDRPDKFNEDTKFVLLLMEEGGLDLEKFMYNELSTPEQCYSIFFQVAISLAIAETKFQFEHRDLHIGNILISRRNEKVVEEVKGPGEKRKKLDDEKRFILNGTEFKIKTYGLDVKIIDFTNSRIKKEEKGEVVDVYLNLGNVKGIFDGDSSSDYQFKIYNMMKKAIGDEWCKFLPKTNCYWLHYLADKLFKFEKIFPDEPTRNEYFNKYFKSLTNYKNTYNFITATKVLDEFKKNKILL